MILKGSMSPKSLCSEQGLEKSHLVEVRDVILKWLFKISLGRLGGKVFLPLKADRWRPGWQRDGAHHLRDRRRKPEQDGQVAPVAAVETVRRLGVDLGLGG